MQDEGTEVENDSEIIFVGGLLSNIGGCELEGVIFEDAIGRAGLISETDTALDTARLPVC